MAIITTKTGQVLECDFTGYVTKNDVKCTDGVTIKQNAFAAQDGTVVPLVFNHMGNQNQFNILGHVKLENRPDGVYGYGKFNDTAAGQNAKELVAHGDLDSMSIWANKLTKIRDDVMHGNICEVSLVLRGANPGAKIDKVYIQHSDGSEEEAFDEAVIQFGEPIEFDYGVRHSGDRTVAEVLDTLTEEQQMAVYATTTAVINAIRAQDGVKQSDIKEGDDNLMHVAPFAKNSKDTGELKASETPALTADVIQSALSEMNTLADQAHTSLKQIMIQHADELATKYGITNIDLMFPDAHDVDNMPEFIKRDTGWVSKVLNGVKHAPYARLRRWFADITHDEARALGYIKGNFKKEEYFSVSNRETRPTTIYKKQRFDRDDLIDSRNQSGIISWVKGEMRMMMNEELARAILIGDGRDLVDKDGKPNPDKINEDCIRPIWKEPELFAIHYNIMNNMPTGSDVTDFDKYSHMIDNIIRAMDEYEGSGNTTLFMASNVLTEMLLLKDKLGRKLYNNVNDFASAIGVDHIVKVPQLKQKLIRTADAKTTGETETQGSNYKLFGIIVDLGDYTVGTDNGGQLSMFDAFDLDYNQYKYLMETRCSGSLMKVHSAIILEEPTTAAATNGAPTPAG